MAELSITAASVRSPSGVPVQVKLATANMEPGVAVYEINSTHVGLANASNATQAACRGIVVTRAYDAQPVGYVGSGTYVAGANIATGQVYALSVNAGLICNHADLTTNAYVTILGYGNNGTTIQLAINPTGLARA